MCDDKITILILTKEKKDILFGKFYVNVFYS